MKSRTIQFSVAPEVPRLGVVVACVEMHDVENQETNHAFTAYQQSVLADLLPQYRQESFVKSDPILAGFRDLHRAVGRSTRRFVSAPEALVTRCARTGTAPHVNLVVDIYNLMSLKTRLSLGAHDSDKIASTIAMRLTNGDELFVPLGATAAEPIFPGEYAYIDDRNTVICRMEVQQGEHTKVALSTTNVFYIVQGNSNTSGEYVTRTLEELVILTKTYCGGKEHIVYLPQ